MTVCLAFVDVTFSNLVPGLAVVAILALIVAYFWVTFRRNSDDAKDKALKDWKDLAEARLAKNKDLEAENKTLKEELKDCAQLRDDFAQHVLRANARELLYQRCINNLEIRLKMEPTNFDDPTQHITQNPDRR